MILGTLKLAISARSEGGVRPPKLGSPYRWLSDDDPHLNVPLQQSRPAPGSEPGCNRTPSSFGFIAFIFMAIFYLYQTIDFPYMIVLFKINL
jgi:hypothetical protein